MLDACRKRPELGELIYHREVLLWVQRMEARGYTLTKKPSPPRLTPCPDPKEPAGSLWAIVRGRFFHHGPVGVIRGDDMQEMQAYRQEIGATDKQDAGVARYLEQQAKAAKEQQK